MTSPAAAAPAPDTSVGLPADATEASGVGVPEAAAAPQLHVRIEPVGPAAERGVAALCASGAVVRDPAALLGAPAAVGACEGGESAVDLLVRAAALALDDTDLHITLQRP